MSLIGENLISLVRKYADKSPDYVYEPPGPGRVCKYVSGGKPSCLIGRALWDAGLINESFEHNDNNRISIRNIYPKLGLALDWYEIEWLGEVQRAQDAQRPWGVAVSGADKRASENYALSNTSGTGTD